MKWFRYSIWRSGQKGDRGATGAAGALVYDRDGLVANAKIWSAPAWWCT